MPIQLSISHKNVSSCKYFSMSNLSFKKDCFPGHIVYNTNLPIPDLRLRAFVAILFRVAAFFLKQLEHLSQTFAALMLAKRRICSKD